MIKLVNQIKECGYESGKWLGQCPGCGEWNTFVEQEVKVQRGKSTTVGLAAARPKPTSIKEVSSAQETRIKTNIGELDRVLAAADGHRLRIPVLVGVQDPFQMVVLMLHDTRADLVPMMTD